MRILIVSVFAVLVVGVGSASAQNVVVGDKLTWDQDAPTLLAANGFTYKIKVDTAAPVALSGVSCVGTVAPFVCSVPFPAFAPGVQHSLTGTASDNGVESLPSTPFAFMFVVVPVAPRNMRITR